MLLVPLSKQKSIPIPPERSMTHGARADCDWAVKSSEKQVSPYCHFQKTALNYGQNDKIVSVILFKNVFKVSLENRFIRDSQIFTAERQHDVAGVASR